MAKFLSKYVFISQIVLIGALSLAPAADNKRGGPPPLTDAQKKCFTDNGVSPPEMDTPPEGPLPSQEVRDKILKCLDANGFKPPTRDLPPLTDAQKKCFSDNGITPPEPNTPPPSTLPSQEVRDKIRACLDANGFKPPTDLSLVSK
ncbi:MAG: hypothetical protein ABI041_09090 [Bdellovibrionia bacterium]